jgi:hypothetical protein
MAADPPRKPGPPGAAQRGPAGGRPKPAGPRGPGGAVPGGHVLPAGFQTTMKKPQGQKRGGAPQAGPMLSDPFGPTGPMPQFGKLQLWQKILLGVCGAVIAGILAIVFATDLIRVPGIETGVLIRHNVEFLGQTITLPRKPISATWQMLPHDVDADSAGGGTAWRIRAVLEFAPADGEAILASARSRPRPADEAPKSAGWFPKPVQQAMETHPTEVLDAGDFYSSLYRFGLLAHIEGTNYFLLDIQTD